VFCGCVCVVDGVHVCVCGMWGTCVFCGCVCDRWGTCVFCVCVCVWCLSGLALHVVMLWALGTKVLGAPVGVGVGRLSVDYSME